VLQKGSPQRGALRINCEIGNMKQVQNAEHNKQDQKQWSYAREAQRIELQKGYLAKGAPASQAGCRDQESRYGKEDDYAVVTVPSNSGEDEFG